MHTDSGHPNQRKFSWWLFGGVAVAGVAVVCWSFLSGSNPAPPPDLSVPATPTQQTADDRQLSGSLREKLPEDTLADLKVLSRSQPEKAIELAESLGHTAAEKAAWIQLIVKQWADQDPGNAWDWVARPNNSLANSSLLTVVMDSMAASNPDMLIGKITDALVVDDKSGSLLAAQNVTTLGLQAVVRSGNIDLAKSAVEAWANDPSKPKVGEAAFDIVAMGMDQKEPANIGAWLRSFPASPERDGAINSLAYNWGKEDPVAALHWAQNLAPEEGQPNAVSRVFGEWIQDDPAKATNWLEGYVAHAPSNIASDEMIGSVVLFSPVTKNNPDEAAKLADSVADPDKRFTYQQQIFQAWARSDATAAIAYVQSSATISPEQKKVLTQEIQEASSPNPPEQ